jgi:hypothetical protein
MNNIIYGNSSVKGGGIYCSDSPSATIINNTIIGNSAISSSVAGGDGDPILHCEYDNHNRPDACYIPKTELGIGGGIYIKSSSPEIMNNIIAFSKESSESSRLTRWYYTDLFMRYNYEGARLVSVNYYYGFKNNGDSGDIHLSGCIKDTSFIFQSGERYWIETTSFVSPYGDGGGIDLTIRLDNDSLKLKVTLPAYFGGCYYLYNTNLQSYGVAQDGVGQGGMSGAGIIAIGDDSFPNIVYNDIYGNDGANYFVGASDSTYEVNLTGINGNISRDPLCEPPDYFLSSGSPCIDAGDPDPSFNDNIRPPGMGTERSDIGAYGGSGNDIITFVDDYATLPSQFLLYQNYPNPFNPETTIRYEVAKPYQVIISVHNLLGQRVILLVDERKSVGSFSVNWDGSSDSGRHLASGIYIIRMQAGEFVSLKKMIKVQ